MLVIQYESVSAKKADGESSKGQKRGMDEDADAADTQDLDTNSPSKKQRPGKPFSTPRRKSARHDSSQSPLEVRGDVEDS